MSTPKKILEKNIQLKVFNINDVPNNWQNLCVEAKKISEQAYAPYSKFRVGAAVLLEDESIIPANNQENAAYPSGLCAERTALFFCSANFPNKKIIAIAIYSPDAINMLTPCGACRQVMLEYEQKQQRNIITILYYKDDVYVLNSVKDWLPFEFGSESLR